MPYKVLDEKHYPYEAIFHFAGLSLLQQSIYIKPQYLYNVLKPYKVKSKHLNTLLLYQYTDMVD